MKKRIFAALVCVVLVLSLLPMPALAVGEKTTLDIREGSITIGNGTVSGYATGGSAVTDHDPDGYRIIGGGTVTTNTITVTAGTHSIILDGVNIDVSVGGGCAFDIQSGSSSGATVNLELVGDNTLQSGINRAGLQVLTNATVTITGTGSLSATGGSYGAGIGGGYDGDGGTVTISGGTVNATGNAGGAGIGGGSRRIGGGGAGDGGTVNISGGTVNATGTSGGAGIGGGIASSGGMVTISGGTVTANGGDGGAGIGGGGAGDGGAVRISGGNVKATGSRLETAGDDGEDIGAGAMGSGGTLTNGTASVYRIILTLEGTPTVDNTPIAGLHTVGATAYDMTDVKPLDDNKLYLYLPEGTVVNRITTGETPKRLFTNQSSADITVATGHGSTGTLTAVAASISNVTVSGKTGTAITPVSATVTLTGEKFVTLDDGDDVSGWFTNLPAGLTAKIKTSGLSGATTATVTFSGTPAAAKTEAIALTIPINRLITYKTPLATVNESARWEITSSDLLQIIRGQGSKWAKGSTAGLSFTSNGEYRWFDGILVDGTTVESGNYTSASGSTIVTLKAAYLETLSAGRHTLRMNFEGGHAETYFTIHAETAEAAVPKTGDGEQPILWLCLVLMAGAVLVANAVRRKKQNG